MSWYDGDLTYKQMLLTNKFKGREEAMTTNAITPDECRKLAGILGITWHDLRGNPACLFDERADITLCSCGERVSDIAMWKHGNPDFFDSRVVLREAVKMDDWPDFAESLRQYADEHNIGSMALIIDYMLDESGRFTKKLLEWIRERRGNANLQM